MTGPSGVDAPAPAAVSMIGDPFRVFSAASQGDWERATALMASMSGEDWRSLVGAVSGMHSVLDTVARTRHENAHAPRSTNLAASSAAAAPSLTEHGHE